MTERAGAAILTFHTHSTILTPETRHVCPLYLYLLLAYLSWITKR